MNNISYVIQWWGGEDIIESGKPLPWKDCVSGSDKETIHKIYVDKRKRYPTINYQFVERKVVDTVLKRSAKLVGKKHEGIMCPFKVFLDVGVEPGGKICVYKCEEGYCDDIIKNSDNSDAFCNKVMTLFFDCFNSFKEAEQQIESDGTLYG